MKGLKKKLIPLMFDNRCFNGIYFFFNPLIFGYLYHNIDTNSIVLCSVSLYSAVPSQRFHLQPRDLLERSREFSSSAFSSSAAETCGTVSAISPSATKHFLTFLEFSSPLSHIQPQNLLE